MKKSVSASIILCVLVLLFLFAGCNPFADKNSETGSASSKITTSAASDPTGTSLSGGETTAAGTTEQSGPPQVVTYYELNKTSEVDDFIGGFIIELPKIVSSKPGAMAINNEVDTMKVRIQAAYSQAGNSSDYQEIYRYSYEAANKENIIFISLLASYGLKQSEFVNDYFYYAYDYVEDKRISDTEIAALYGMSSAAVTTGINNALAANGTAVTIGFDKIDLFAMTGGKLFAKAELEGEMGEYPEFLKYSGTGGSWTVTGYIW